MTAKKKAEKKVQVKLSPEEEKKLKEWAKAYPDEPSLSETAHRLLEQELHKDRRG